MVHLGDSPYHPSNKGQQYPFWDTGPFNQSLRITSFPEAICRAAQAAYSGSVSRFLHFCTGTASCFSSAGSQPLLKTPHATSFDFQVAKCLSSGVALTVVSQLTVNELKGGAKGRVVAREIIPDYFVCSYLQCN